MRHVIIKHFPKKHLHFTLPILALTVFPHLLLHFPTPAQAQSQTSLSQQSTHTFTIPPQSLETALAQFSEQSGLQIGFAADLIGSAQSSGLSGNYTVLDALEKLLAEQTITYLQTDDASVILQKVSFSSEETIDNITTNRIDVTGEAESAIGPDFGIVGTRSTTGSKTDTALARIPQAVSVITEDELSMRSEAAVSDSLAYTAGVQTNLWGVDKRYERFVVRGFDDEGGLFKDGINQRIGGAFSSMRDEPYGLQRIEVLKGSTSSLYGAVGPGGLINVITKRPPEEFQADAHIGFGSFNRKEVAGDIGGPLDEAGQFFGRFTALYRDSGTQNDHNEDDSLYLAPALTWKPSDKTSWSLLATFQDRNTPRPVLTPYEYAQGKFKGHADRAYYSGDPSFDDISTRSKSITSVIDHQFDNGFSLHQNMRYKRVDTDWHYAYGTTPLTTDPSKLVLNTFSVNTNSDQFGMDTNVQHRYTHGAIENHVLFGIDYAYEHTKEKLGYGGTHIAGTSPVTPIYRDWTIDRRSLGIYGQDQFTYDALTLTLGGRYDIVHTDVTDRVNSFGSYGKDSKDTAFSGRVGLNYQFDFGLSPYASYSTSFVPWVPNSGSTDLNPVQPSKGEQYEFGLKYEPGFANALITASLFDLTKTNVENPDPANPLRSIRTGEINVQGLEFEARADLVQGLTFIGSAAFLKPEITKSTTAEDLGNVPQTIAQRSLSAWLNYQNSDFSLGGGVRHIGSSYADNANLREVDSYTVFDASAQYNLTDNWALNISAKNLFDTEYYTICYTDSCSAGERLNVFGSVKYTW